MRKIFHKTDILDKRAQKKFYLSEEILMENAARSLSDFIKSKARKNTNVLFLCGQGNNGADGYAAARMLFGNLDVSIFCVYEPKTELAKIQCKRAKALKIKFVKTLPKNCDVYVDCVLGSAQRGSLDRELEDIISFVNAKEGVKIACDMPTGIYSKTAFKADFTLAMGALKEPLFEDYAKDFAGDIVVCDLGVDRSLFEDKTDMFLLEKSDLKLPKRENKNSNKGDFGHLVVVGGERKGASILAGLSALSFGVGLVSLLTDEKSVLEPSLMQTSQIPAKTTAIAAGMGLGDAKMDFSLFEKFSFVIDADLCYDERILQIENANGVITPHPKEFLQLLEIFGFGSFSVERIQANRFEFAKMFSLKFKGVLVLKGANTIIAQNGVLYVCDFGSQALSKGGSGDVLAGLIGALLAQGSAPIEAALNGVMAHALASSNFKANDYSLTPQKLIEEIRWL